MPRILIVDDEWVTRAEIEAMLTDLGYEVIGQAETGTEAIEIVRSLEPDLIIMDVMMPGEMNGIDAARVIKAEWGTPIIFITGYGDPDYIEAAKEIAPFGYVMKPFDEREVHAFIEIALSKRELELKEMEVHEGLERANLVLQEEIASRKKTEKALRESEKLYRDIFEKNKAMKWILDPSTGKIIDANSAACEFYQYTHEEMTKLYLWDINLQGETEMKKTLARAEAEEQTEFTFKHRKASGEIRDVQVYTGTFESGGKMLLHSIIIDITERKRSEEALKESEEKFRDLFDNAPLGYLEYDRDGRITRVNQTNLNMLGYNREEMVGKFIWDLYVEKAEAREQILAKLAGRLPPGRGFMRTYRRKDESILPVLVEDRLLRDDRQQIAGIRCTFQDIMDRKQAEEALRESEKKYRQLFETAMVGIYRTGIEDGKFLAANESLAKMLGYASVDTLVEEYITSEHYADPERRQELLSLLLKYGKVDGFEIEMKRGDGSPIQIAMSARIYPELGYLEGVIIDITERKRAEEALRSFKDLVEHSSDAIGMSTPEGIHYYQNKAFDVLFGNVGEYPPDTLYVDKEIGKQVFDTIMGGGSWQGEVKMFKKDMTILDIFLRAYAIQNQDGRVIGLVGLHTDITERKQAEAALKESESNLQSVFDAVPVGISFMKNRVYQRANQNWCDSFGYPEERLIGKTPEFLYESREEYERVGKELYGHFPEDGIRSVHTRLKRSDDEFRDVVLISKLLDAQDMDAGMVIVVHDITEQNRVKKEKRRLEAQLQQTQKMKAIGTLAGGIAHDFNNLLMAIQGRTSIILKKKDSSHPDFGHLMGIEGYVESAADLTKQLLGFARGGKYEVKPTDLNELIKKESRMFGRTKKEITLHEKYQDNLWPVEVDRGQIQQVLLNLYVNAWQAMLSGGELRIRTQNVTLDENYLKPHQFEPGRYVQISITDTGIGMDKATRERIFDPFFTTKEMGRGTGLGLASAYGILRNHGGFINVYSEKGHGSTFNIYLPASEKVVIEEEKSAGDILKGTETVLFVDDEEMITETGEDLLVLLGYNVLIAGSGKEAIRIYEENKDQIDMVVLDMIMPDMSGGATYDKIKETNPNVKVLLSSGYSINGQATEILDRGCNGFIQKPFKMKELSQKLREILDEK